MQALVLAQQQKFTLLPAECPEVSVGPDLEFSRVPVGFLRQQFPQMKGSVLLRGSLLKLWGDTSPSRVPAGYQVSAGP